MDAPLNTYDLLLDMRRVRCRTVVRLRQGDTAIAVSATIVDAGTRYQLGDKRVRFEAVKPDGTWIREEAEVTGASTISYALPPEIASTPGVIDTAYFRVLALDESVVGSTGAFTIEVLPSIEGAIGGESVSYCPELDALMDEMRQLIVDGGAKDYAALVGKPTVNGRTLEGELELADLGIKTMTNRDVEAMFQAEKGLIA